MPLSLSWLGHTPKCYRALTSFLDREDKKILFSRDHDSIIFSLGPRQSTRKVLISLSISLLTDKPKLDFAASCPGRRS